MYSAGTDTYIQDLEAWRESMDASIRKENGWLALAGLYWLQEGENTFGSAATNDIVLPDPSPRQAGTFHVRNGRIHLGPSNAGVLQINGQAAGASALELDTSGDPTHISLGQLTMIVIQRGEKIGVRLWDNNRLARQTYPRRIWFPGDLSWRLEADFKAHHRPITLSIPNILGEATEEAGVGQVVFSRRDQEHRLEAIQTESGGLWLIFGDLTNGAETYPSGRFLLSPPPAEGRVVVDFNRAYNPPCAFTDFATCPLPPRENVLDLRVQAGERYQPPAGSHP